MWPLRTIWTTTSAIVIKSILLDMQTANKSYNAKANNTTAGRSLTKWIILQITRRNHNWDDDEHTTAMKEQISKTPIHWTQTCDSLLPFASVASLMSFLILELLLKTQLPHTFRTGGFYGTISHTQSAGQRTLCRFIQTCALLLTGQLTNKPMDEWPHIMLLLTHHSFLCAVDCHGC